jgi:hypothetical protein
MKLQYPNVVKSRGLNLVVNKLKVLPEEICDMPKLNTLWLTATFSNLFLWVLATCQSSGR